MSERLLILAIGSTALSGVPGLLFGRLSTTGQWVATWLTIVGAGFGFAGVGMFWATGSSRPVILPWALFGVDFHVVVDGLSAVFLVPIFLIAVLGNTYGHGYWKQREHPRCGRKLRLFYGSLTAGMALLVMAGNSIVFLFGWEIMALSAYFLVATEDDQQDVRETAWIYLVATHVATLCLFALFAILRAAGGSFALVRLSDDSLTPTMATVVFALALVAFGLKAGMMPFHVWLPSAHAITPSHVSAIMSGVIIKMGIYGLARVLSLLPQPPIAWGAVILGLGVVSGVLGVVFAIGQHDLKRLLAYHSIENIGIIVMGLGLATIGRSLGRADCVVLGMSGALLHVWNHALFKALLFFAAGSVIHAAHTREIDQLGGLAKTMPRTATCFLVGAVAICGLPPLNGFVSELLIYLGLFGTLGESGGPPFPTAAFTAPALALIGALALACFVKVFAAVFLGVARSTHARDARESPATMIGSMIVLVACCIIIGLAPLLVVPVLGLAVGAWAPGFPDAPRRLMILAPMMWISIMGLMLLGTVGLVGIALQYRISRGTTESRSTWSCGYANTTPRMQYTGSSFAQMLVRLFAWVLRPRLHIPGQLGLFPQKSDFHSHTPDVVLDEAVLPAFHFGARVLSWCRVFQQGNIQAYLLYIFLALLALLVWR